MTVLKIIFYALFVFINLIIADVNNQKRLSNIASGNTAQINHYFWSGLYLVLVAAMWFPFHNWFYIGGLILQRLGVFPVLYNLEAKLPPFNLSKTSDAITDRALVKLGFKNSFLINAAALVGSIVLACFP